MKANTLADRVRAAISNGAAENSTAARIGDAMQGERALLLDVSGSMEEDVEPGRTKIEALRQLVAQFPGVRMFAFANACRSITAVPKAGGQTNMPAAFRTVRSAGVRHAVLITDGLPQDEAGSLRAAAGLRLDIFYVGPPPRPEFLARLASVTGGTFEVTTLARPAAKALRQSVAARLLLTGGGKS